MGPSTNEQTHRAWWFVIGAIVLAGAVAALATRGESQEAVPPAASVPTPTPEPTVLDRTVPEVAGESIEAVGGDVEGDAPRVNLDFLPDDVPDPYPGLDVLLQRLADEASAAVPGAVMGIAVQPLDGSSRYEANGDVLFVSASSAKAWWTAAALAAGNAEAAALQAPELFELSSDEAAGVMIDLAGGMDAVNEYTASLGMADTGLVKWITSTQTRYSWLYPGHLYEDSNYTTPRDAVAFLAALADGTALDAESAELLRAWMTTSPRSAADTWAVASTIPHGLPPAVQATVEHKAGWLAPSSEPHHPTLLDIGIVHPADGSPSYAIAVMAVAEGASDAEFTNLVAHFQYASCEIYRTMSHDDSWNCPGG